MIYQISRDQETSSSCSECKRQHQEIQNDSHPQLEQSSSEEQDIKLPVMKPRSTLPQHEETTSLIALLHQEIKQLRINNDSKDKVINELKKQLKYSKSNFFQQPYYSTYKEYPHTSKEIPKIRAEGHLSSSKAIKRGMFSPQIKPRYQEQSRLQVVLLEKQIKELQIKVMQLSSKLKEYEENCDWMQKFITSFVNMAQDLSLKYGGNVHTRGLSLRKKTKVSWKYTKQLINYLIQ